MTVHHASPGFTAPEPAELAPLFPGYEIESLIATGGMGAVYCAVQKSLERTVALKILPKEFSSDAAFCAGFEAEAKAMARLNHPNLIGVYDFGEVNGMLFIIMEYVPGKSIYHSAYGRAIDQLEVIRLVTGICHGLAHAHANGILHRDIKPSNVLLDLNAQPKIGDFGLARPIDWQIEEGEEIFGTPHYTAPEVVNAPHTVDYRADIFSVGVMLHELLTGKLPANDPRPASVIIHCDPRFDAIIKRATQQLPAARYANADEMAKELQAIATSLTTRAVPRANQPGIHRTVKQPRAHVPAPKKSSGTPVMIVLLLVAAAAAAYVFTRKPPQKTVVDPTTVEQPVNPTPTPKSTHVEPDVPAVDDSVIPSHDTPPPTDITHETPPSDDEAMAGGDETTEVEKPPVDEGPAPKFDVDGFLKERARPAMQEKAKPLVSVHHSALVTNFGNFEKDIRRVARKNKVDNDKVDALIETWRANDNRIPEAKDSKIFTFAEVEEIRSGYEVRQTGFDDTLDQSIGQLAPTYIKGIELQIKRLEAEKDDGAIKLLQDEIDSTKDSPRYFRNLMLESAAE